MENDKVNLANLATLIEILDTAFSNPNRVAEAKSKLSILYQGNREFILYYTKFQHYATDVQWDEVAKLAALRKGLSYRLKNNFFMAATNPATVADLITLCNHLDICYCRGAGVSSLIWWSTSSMRVSEVCNVRQEDEIK